MTTIIQAAEQIILSTSYSVWPTRAGEEDEENDCILIWRTISDYLYAAEPDELQKLDPTVLPSFTTLVLNHPEELDLPGVADLGARARFYNEVLRSSLKLDNRIPGGINPALLEKLETRCLESFQTFIEDLGFHLTDWDKIIKEPVNSELRNLDIMGGTPDTRWKFLYPTSQHPTREEYQDLGLGDLEIVRNPDDSDDNWRVRRFRSSYHERYAAMLAKTQITVGERSGTQILGGGVIEKRGNE